MLFYLSILLLLFFHSDIQKSKELVFYTHLTNSSLLCLQLQVFLHSLWGKILEHKIMLVAELLKWMSKLLSNDSKPMI